VGKPEGKRPVGKPRHMWVDTIKLDLGDGAWLRIRTNEANTVMSLWIPENVGKFLSGCTTGGLSSSAQLHSESVISPGI
jgi:hypothetical protein